MPLGLTTVSDNPIMINIKSFHYLYLYTYNNLNILTIYNIRERDHI